MPVAFVERFIQTLQQECLDYFEVFGAKHMDQVVSEMLGDYHEDALAFQPPPGVSL